MANKPDASRRPGQHEELERLALDLHKKVDKLTKLSEEERAIDIRFLCPVNNELMQSVREILTLLKARSGGLSKAEEDKLAAKLDKGANTLQGAVDANQP